MKPGIRFPRHRRMVIVAIGIALVALAWNYSAVDPVFRDPESPLIPLAFSPDGKILAAADWRGANHWWEGPATRSGVQLSGPAIPLMGPGGPIHLLRADDLTPTGPPIETPTIIVERGAHYPTIQSVEFSPNGDLLAVLQKSHVHPRERTDYELLLIQLPEGKIVRSFSFPYNLFSWHDRVGGRFFSPDGRLVAWHEDLATADRGVVRVWDLAESHERFAAEGVTYPMWSPDGRWLAAVETSKPEQKQLACRLYDVRNGQVVHSLPLPGDRQSFQPWPEFSPDGRLLLVKRQSDRREGEVVVVFDVASEKKVFEAWESSSYFVDGATLVSVNDNTVLFRDTKTWQIRSQSQFSLRTLFGEASPVPHPVPGRSAVLVYDDFPIKNDFVDTLGRNLHLKLQTPLRGTWIDAASGEKTPFTACEGLLWRTAISPGGDRLFTLGQGLTIWDLPPRRTWIPTAVVAGLLTLIWGGWIVFRRKQRGHSEFYDEQSL